MMYSIPQTKSDYQVPIALRMIGANHLQEPIERPKGLPLFQWFYCVKGKGEFVLHHQKYVLSKGEGALLYPYEAHSYRSLTNDWTLHFFGFQGPSCADLLKVLHMPESNVYHFSIPDIFLSHMQNLEQLHKRKMRNKHLEFSKEIYSFLLDLSTSISRIETSDTVQENKILHRIVFYLEDNYANAVSLTDLSDYMHLSKEYLCTVFKKEMQQTIFQYLLSLRINHARVFLIQYPEKKSYEIGQLCGFDSPSYFVKVFKKTQGCTPEEYRSKSYM